jgi:hypothetical protein
MRIDPVPCQITSIIVASISSRSSKVFSVGSSVSVSLKGEPQGTPREPGNATLVLLPTLIVDRPAEKPVSGLVEGLVACSLLAV